MLPVLLIRAVKFSYTWSLLLKDHSVKFPSSQSVRELDGPGDDEGDEKTQHACLGGCGRGVGRTGRCSTSFASPLRG